MWSERDETLTAALPADVRELGWYAVDLGVLRNPAQPWVIVCWPENMTKACESAKTISCEAERLREARAREIAEKAGKVAKPKRGRPVPVIRQEAMEF
jgi:hypothetical protein